MARNYLRACSLSLTGNSGRTLTGGGPDDLRIVFAIKQWGLQSPNMGRFRIYNPSPKTRSQFQNKEFSRIEFSAGYQENTGLIFSGDIKQSIAGHETATDTYIDIFAADMDRAYNQGRVSTTLAAGHTPQDRVDAAVKAMQPFGASLGLVNIDLSQPRYSRGIPLVGMARDVLRSVALSAGATWSLQQGKVHIVDQRKPVTGDAITLTASTGLVGWPRQTEDGIEVRSLINPALQPHVNIKLDPSQIIAAERNNNPFAGGDAALSNTQLDAQALGAGTYNIFHLDRVGDTRGQDWYDISLCIGQGGSLGVSATQQGYYLGQS